MPTQPQRYPVDLRHDDDRNKITLREVSTVLGETPDPLLAFLEWL